jgi:hypothetical protein
MFACSVSVGAENRNKHIYFLAKTFLPQTSTTELEFGARACLKESNNYYNLLITGTNSTNQQKN